jgi:hypothetical protein
LLDCYCDRVRERCRFCKWWSGLQNVPRWNESLQWKVWHCFLFLNHIPAFLILGCCSGKHFVAGGRYQAWLSCVMSVVTRICGSVMGHLSMSRQQLCRHQAVP